MEGNLLIKILSSREAEIYKRLRQYAAFKLQEAYELSDYTKKLKSCNCNRQIDINIRQARYALGITDERPHYPYWLKEEK